VRFPNEINPIEINFDVTEFTPDKEYDDEIFGYWRGVYIAVKK
jgi:hypothetical protein